MTRVRPVVLVTGATSGIGWATALELARRGCEVIVHGRTEASAAEAASLLRAALPSAELRAVHADLGSLREVRGLAAGLTSLPEGAMIDVVIHNAGLERWERTLTPDGIEETFAVNHVAPYLLTRLLAPSLPDTARILYVSSMVHAWGQMHWDDLGAERWYAPEPVYYQSKLAAALGAGALARRLAPRGIDVFLVPPGLTRTRFGRDFRGMAAWWAGAMGRLMFRDPAVVAREIAEVALAPHLAGLGFAYVDRGVVTLPAECARVDADVARLERITCGLAGLAEDALPPPLSPPRLDPPRLGPWVRNIALGEMLGFAATVLIAFLGITLGGSPDTVFGHTVALVVMTAAGILEGTSLGYFTWRALRGWLPDLSKRRFVSATIAVATLGWFVGMAVPLVGTAVTAAAPAGDAPMVEPQTAEVVLFAMIFGAIAGSLFGFAQGRVLAPHVARWWPWVLGQSVGWALGLPLSYLAGSLGADVLGPLGSIAVGSLAGLGMGLSVALATFVATRRM